MLTIVDMAPKTATAPRMALLLLYAVVRFRRLGEIVWRVGGSKGRIDVGQDAWRVLEVGLTYVEVKRYTLTCHVLLQGSKTPFEAATIGRNNVHV